MKTLLTCLLFSIASSAQSADIKKWIDEGGQIHYGAIPPTGANIVKSNIHNDPPPPESEILKRKLELIEFQYNENAKEIARRQRNEQRNLNNILRQVSETQASDPVCPLYDTWIGEAKVDLENGYTGYEGAYYESQIDTYERKKKIRNCK